MLARPAAGLQEKATDWPETASRGGERNANAPGAGHAVMEMIPDFVQGGAPAPLTVTDQEKVPAAAYPCEGFCRADVPPSPNVHA